MRYRTKDQSSGSRERVLTIDTRLVLWKLERESERGFGVKTCEERQSWESDGAAWNLDGLVQGTLHSPFQQQSHTLPRLP